MVSYTIKVSACRVWYSAKAPARIECEHWVKVCKCFAKAFSALEPVLRKPVTEIWVCPSSGTFAAVSNGMVLRTVTGYGFPATSSAQELLASLMQKVLEYETW